MTSRVIYARQRDALALLHYAEAFRFPIRDDALTPALRLELQALAEEEGDRRLVELVRQGAAAARWRLTVEGRAVIRMALDRRPAPPPRRSVRRPR